MPSLQCLIYALTQAGRGDLLFRFTSSVHSCYGEGGALQTDIDSTHSVSATLGLLHTGVSVLSPSTLLSLLAALYGAGPVLSGFQFSGPPQKRGFSCACVLCRPRPQRLRQPGAWAHFPRMWYTFSFHGKRPRQPGAWANFPPMWRAFSLCGEQPRQPKAWATFPRCGAPFLSAAPALTAGRVSGSLYIGTEGLFALWEGVASLGLSLPLSPPTSSGDGPALLWSFLVPLFCEPQAVCSGRLIFPCSPTV